MAEPQMHEFVTSEGYWNALAVYRGDETERLRNVQQSNEALLIDNLELRNEVVRLRAVHADVCVALVEAGQVSFSSAVDAVKNLRAERDVLLKLLEIWRTWYAQTAHTEFTPKGLLKDTDAAIIAARWE